MPHTEIEIKVNAWVDEGVAPLVTALNDIDGVLTLDSCENGATGRAFVFFTYGQDWKELATLVETISNVLGGTLPYGFSMHLEWLGGITPRAQILVDPEHAAPLADVIADQTTEINRRMSSSVGDRRRKVPQHLTTC